MDIVPTVLVGLHLHVITILGGHISQSHHTGIAREDVLMVL
jgi:hypothetical protein